MPNADSEARFCRSRRTAKGLLLDGLARPSGTTGGRHSYKPRCHREGQRRPPLPFPLERQIDDLFFDHGIPHQPEPHYPYDPDINPDGYRADWRLADDTYVEALGFTANPVYMAEAQRKIALADLHQIPS